MPKEKQSVSQSGASAETSDKPAKRPVKTSRSEAHEEAAFQQTANDMKSRLAAEPKVEVFIPLSRGEPKGTQLPVEINGHKMWVPKGVVGVKVPKSVAEIIWQSLGVYEEASANLMSPNDPSRHLRTDLQSDSDRQRINA